MAVLFVAAVGVVLLAVLCCCKVSGECAEQERRAGQGDPCESCHIWHECKGAGDECPLRKEVK